MTTTDYPARIAALLSTAESLRAAGNEDAANSYTAKASELQLKRMISDSDIHQAAQSKSTTDTLISRNVQGLAKGAGYIKAKRDLVYGLASIFNIKITIAGDRSFVTMHGFTSDLDFVQTLFDSLSLQMLTAMEFDAFPGCGRSWRTSHAHGWVARVTTRLREVRSYQEREANDSTPGTTIMIRDRGVAVTEYFDDRFAGVRMRSSYKNRSIRDGHGYTQGDAAGRRADIGGTRLEGRKQLG